MAALDSRDPTAHPRRLDYGKRQVENHSLISNLWHALPAHLIELILAKLPFSSLVRFCSVSKQWRDLIRVFGISPQCSSEHGRLFFFSIYDDKKLTIFNSGRGTWEIAPLEFLEKQFSLVDVVASAGGLLCFCTCIYGEFIVCNPITKCYKRLQIPCNKSLTISEQPFTPVAYCSKAGSLELLVGMILDADTGNFQLLVGGILSTSRQTSLLYDSHSHSWKKVGDVPAHVHCTRVKSISCGGNLFFFFSRSYNGEKILKYIAEAQAWSWIPNPEKAGSYSTIFEQSGKIVHMSARENLCAAPLAFLIYGPQRRVEVLELQDSGPLLWLPARRLHLTSICETIPDLCLFDCLGQGDVTFFILRRCASLGLERSLERRTIRVGQHNETTNFNVISKWEDSIYQYDNETFLWQIFKPSMFPIN